MKNNRKILALATGALLMAGLSAAAFAHPGGSKGGFAHRGGMGGMPGMHLLRMADALELTEQQELAAIQMRRAIRDEAKLNREAMKAAFADVIRELEKPQPDAARLHQLVDQASARMTKLAHSSVDQYLELHRTLSDEQRQTLVESARAAQERHKQFRKQRFQK